MTEAASDLITNMAEQCRTLFEQRSIDQPLVLGIHTGGAWVAEALRRELEIDTPAGALNISFYRDDFSQIGLHPQVRPSDIPFDLEDQHILLVDDVLYTGRTIRAALNEIFDYGRPASITLAVLIERDGRELPVEASVVGKHLTLNKQQQVKIAGPEPMSYSIIELEQKQ